MNKLELVKKVFIAAVEEKVVGHVYYKYSGRMMHGRTCTGLVMYTRDLSQLFEVASEVLESREDLKTFFQVLSDRRVDNLGMDYIHYFPGVDLDRPEEVEE